MGGPLGPATSIDCVAKRRPATEAVALTLPSALDKVAFHDIDRPNRDTAVHFSGNGVYLDRSCLSASEGAMYERITAAQLRRS